MKTILKWPLPEHGYHKIALPLGSEFMSVADVAGEPAIYTRSDIYKHAEAPPHLEVRNVYVAFTGQQIPDEVTDTFIFLGTVVMKSGLVLHVFVGP